MHALVHNYINIMYKFISFFLPYCHYHGLYECQVSVCKCMRECVDACAIECMSACMSD